MTLPGHLLGSIVNIDLLMNPAQSDFSLPIIIHFRPVGPPQLYWYLLHFKHFSGYSRLMGPLKVAAHSRVVCPKSSLALPETVGDNDIEMTVVDGTVCSSTYDY